MSSSRLANRFRSAADRAKTYFDQYVEAFGRPARWRRRTSATGNTSGSMSAAAGIADPVDDGWVDRVEDPLLYEEAGSVLIVKDVPGSAQAENVGQMVTGTALAYCRTEDEVEQFDVLIIDGVRWHVDGSRLTSPPIERELTLRRE